VEQNLLKMNDDQIYFDGPEPFTGVAYQLRDDGSVWAEQTLLHGVPDGPTRSWYPNGQLKTETNYKLGWGDGVSREWYPDGRLKSYDLIECGISIECKGWDEAGALIDDYHIDPASGQFSRLQQLRATEEDRVRRFYEKYGKRPVV